MLITYHHASQLEVYDNTCKELEGVDFDASFSDDEVVRSHPEFQGQSSQIEGILGAEIGVSRFSERPPKTSQQNTKSPGHQSRTTGFLNQIILNNLVRDSKKPTTVNYSPNSLNHSPKHFPSKSTTIRFPTHIPRATSPTLYPSTTNNPTNISPNNFPSSSNHIIKSTASTNISVSNNNILASRPAEVQETSPHNSQSFDSFEFSDDDLEIIEAASRVNILSLKRAASSPIKSEPLVLKKVQKNRPLNLVLGDNSTAEPLQQSLGKPSLNYREPSLNSREPSLNSREPSLKFEEILQIFTEPLQNPKDLQVKQERGLVNSPFKSPVRSPRKSPTKSRDSPTKSLGIPTRSLLGSPTKPGFTNKSPLNFKEPAAKIYSGSVESSTFSTESRGFSANSLAGPIKSPVKLNEPPLVPLPRGLSIPFFPSKYPVTSTSNLSMKLATPAPPAPRNFSTSTSTKATRKKVDSYPSIQLATQRAETPEEALTGPLLKCVKPMLLSSEQEYVLQRALEGESLFYTGSAGTGKSVLLRSIIKALKHKYQDGVAVTASTGLAACNIGGTTLHNFAGVGLANETADKLIKKLRKNKRAFTRWLTCKVLIIDEISMIDGHLLNKFNEIAKTVRKNRLPFGGIQLVVCGDFYQLPPVVKNTNLDGSELDFPVEVVFAFESEAWRESIKRNIILKEIFRQKGDQKFIDMLNEMRKGRVSAESAQEFHKLRRPLECASGIVPAELFATRLEVDRANNTRLNRIAGLAQVYTSVDGGTLANPQRQNLLSNFLATNQLFLKVDAQVMCIKNYDETLVNGSLGQVIAFMDKDTYMEAYENSGGDSASEGDVSRSDISDIGDISVDSTFEASDVSEITEPRAVRPRNASDAAIKASSDYIFHTVDAGQSHEVPVVLASKLKASKNLLQTASKLAALASELASALASALASTLVSALASALASALVSALASALVSALASNKGRKNLLGSDISKDSKNKKYPLVRFLLPDGVNTRTVLVEPESWTVEDENNVMLVSRVQLPLILAWSLSIHKSQGQTLPKVKVDLKNIFETGQAYVALSRAVSRQGLQVLNFNESKVRTHPKVTAFYKTLGAVGEEVRRGQQMLNFTNQHQ